MPPATNPKAGHELGPHDHRHHADGAAAQAGAHAGHRVKDPVCGMSVDPHTAKHRAEHGGRPYYFCSAACRTKFLADPERYLEPPIAPIDAAPVPEGAIYTC